MLIEILKSKILRAETTDSRMDYEGSLAIDQDLMEKVALSSWGSAEITGYVKWVKDTNTTTNRTTTEYYVKLRDTGSHGFKDEVAEKDVSRAKIFTEGAVAITAPTTPGTPYPCTLK